MSTLFDSYTDPDIPGIFTSVTDNSISETQIESDRSVFLAMPLKYGDENVMVFSDSTALEAAVGAENSFKYGLGQFYARSFITAGATVFIKKINDASATYANQLLRRSPDYYGLDGKTADTNQNPFIGIGFKNVKSKDTLIQVATTDTAVVKSNKTETVFSLLAKGRGAGYNDLFAVYKNANDYERFDATDDGVINYKFNFVNMVVMENNSFTSEVKTKSNNVIFSLMDIDPITKNMITHKSTGAVLHVNDIVENSNFYLSAKINPAFQAEIRKYPNIEAVLADKNKPFFFVESEDTISDPTLTADDRKWYEVSMDDSTTPSSFKIQRATFSANRQLTAQPVFAVNEAGTTKYYQAVIKHSNASLSLDFTPYLPSTAGYIPTYPIGQVAYIDGTDAFYTLKLAYNTTTSKIELSYEPFRFLRWELYSALMKYNMKLNEGEDNTSSSGFVNTDGSANLDAIAQGIYEYIRDDKEIREVIYPKFTFNYCIDWTNSIKVKSALAVLADRVKRTMHITSCPSVRLTSTGLSADYSIDNDKLCREQYLAFSSYNSMIYSSQHNKTHFDSKTKQTHKIPSCFYALLDHLYVDKNISITEPVANIDKGIIRTSNLKLSHEIYSEDIADLRKLQINCIVTDGSDQYFIDQLTAYKKTSKLSLANVVKTLQYIQTILPKKLKKYLQKKETDVALTSNVLNDVQEVLKPYKSSTNSDDSIFKDVSINPSFNNEVLTIAIRVTPAGTTEKINIPIIVQS